MNLFIARLRNPGLTYSMDWHFSTLFEPPSHTTPFLYLCDLTNIHTPVHASKETWGSLPYLRMEKPGIEPLTLSAHQITYCRLAEAKGLGHRINRTFGEGQLCCQSRRLLYSQFQKEKFRCASEMPSPSQHIVCR